MPQSIAVKNMVCPRCILVVEQLLQQGGIIYDRVELGKILLKEDHLSDEQYRYLDEALVKVGFEILDNLKQQLIEEIKIFLRQKIADNEPLKVTEQIAKLTGYDYSYVSSLFSQSVGITIEQYIIDLRIEKAKELLKYDDLNLNAIADLLGYSQPSHFSRQFKQQTGSTPTEFRRLHSLKR